MDCILRFDPICNEYVSVGVVQVLAWKTRRVPGAFNDAMKVIILDVFLFAFIGIVIPFQVLLSDTILLSMLRAFATIFVVLLFISVICMFDCIAYCLELFSTYSIASRVVSSHLISCTDAMRSDPIRSTM